MTACKDSLSGKKAVSATLAGVLAVGMVPAAAFAADADQADTQSGDEGISLLATNKADFEAGKVAAAENALGQEITGDALKSVEFEAGSNKVGLTITEWQPQVGAAVEINQGDWTVATYVDTNKNGKIDANETTTVDGSTTKYEAGSSYVVKYTGKEKTADGKDNPYKNYVMTASFKVVGQSLDGVTLYEHVASATEQDYTDNEFEWTGSAIDVKATKDGAAFAADSIKYYKNGTEVLAANLKQPGDYVARVTKGGKTTDIPFTINKLDLSKATVEMKDVPAKKNDDGTVKEPQTFAIDKINGIALGTIDPDGDISAAITSTAVYGDNGNYTFKVTAKDSSKYATGSKDVSWDKVTTQAVLKYGTETINSGDKKTFSKATPFVASNLKMYEGTDAGAAAIDEDDLTITVTDEDGNVLPEGLDALEKAGKYKVTVKVNSADLSTPYSVGGEVTFSATVTGAQVAGAGVYFMYDGTVLDQGNGNTAAKTVKYDGTDIAPNVTTKVKSGKKELVEGTDYTVEITKDGKAVDEAVLPGTYTFTIKSDTYVISDNKLQVAISAIPVTKTRAAGTQTAKDGSQFLAYTGEAIDLALEYETTGKTAEKDQKWAELPAASYDVKSIKFTAEGATKAKDVKEIKDNGKYVVTIVESDSDEADNYTFAPDAKTITVVVSDQRVFKDVPNGEWFTDPIYSIAFGEDYQFGKKYDADGNEVACGIMTGYNGSDFFGPYNELTRAETATLLGRLAGVNVDGDDYVSDMGGYATQFTDVAKGAWYANAVAWAAKAGVVTGYSADTFAPDQSITREQFALMLYRYADKCGYDTTADATDLAALPDASGVSDWAETAVEWAVSKGFIGQGGVVDAQGTITRGMAATIMVRFMDAYMVK